MHAYYTSSSGGRAFISDISTDSWTLFPPYGDVDGDIAGENPTITAIELYVTPYDSWQGYDGGPEEAEVTDLTAGGVIGFAIVVSEDDGEDSWYPLTPEAVQTEEPWENLLFLYRADLGDYCEQEKGMRGLRIRDVRAILTGRPVRAPW